MLASSDLETVLSLLDVRYCTDDPGWVGAVDLAPNIPPPGERKPATKKRLDFSPHFIDDYEPEEGVARWFKYPDDARSLAEWILDRHPNRVWLTIQPVRSDDRRLGFHRYKGWIERRPGRNYRYILEPPSRNGKRPSSEATSPLGGLEVYEPQAHLPDPPQWVWPNRIPMRMVTMFDGDPDLGKSTVTLDIAARVTRGHPFPDGTPCDHPGGVVLFSAEDDPHHTMQPRLMAAGADLKKISIVAGLRDPLDGSLIPPSVPGDVESIRTLVRQRDVRLVVIDPFIAYLDEGIDSYRDNQVRRAMSALKLLAEDEDMAVVLVRHLKKDSGGGPAIYGGGGSIGFIAHARAGMIVSAHPEDHDVRVLAQSKLNIAVKGPSLSYRVVPWDEHPAWGRIAWGEAVDYTADQLLATKPREATKQDDAEDWLLETLTKAGERRADALEKEAKEQGHSHATYRRARKTLTDAGLIDKRKVAGDDPHWEWFATGGDIK